MSIRFPQAAAAVLALVALFAVPADAQTPSRPSSSSGDIHVIADQLEQTDGLLIATGNVEITRGSARLTADRVEMNRETGDAVALGRVVFYDGEDRLTAPRIDYNFHTGTGVVHDGDARSAPYYRLSGERLERIGDSIYRVRRGIFTTCEDDPPPWSFHVGSGTADLNEFVYGTNASFWVRNIPLIPWIPFLAAAIRRERQTGFLFPKLGTSSSKGLSAEVPFFWAISDSQDATIAPLLFERRGFGLNAEYRYLLSSEHTGNMRGFYVREAVRDDDDRGWASIRHTWIISRGLHFKADVRGVTDDNVLREYGDPLHQRSEQRVESHVFLTRSWTSWNLVGNAFWYQDLTTRRHVELNRLPEISLTGVRQPLPGVPGALWELTGSATRFVRDAGSDGSRVDVNPRVSRPFTPGGIITVTPFVGARLTAYDRRVTGSRVRDGRSTEETVDDAQLRRLFEAGSDVEMTASRIYRAGFWNLDSLLHTIEPRVNYTWMDGRHMDRLPFWTDLDRLRDTSRIEYSLTNRVRAKTAAPPNTDPLRLEVMRLVLAHSIDLKEDDHRTGDVLGDLILQPTPSLRFRSTVRHETQARRISNANTDVSAKIGWFNGSVGWRYSDAERLSFAQVSAVAEVHRHVTGRLSSNWDVRSGRFVENRYGVDIKFQCYTITVDYVNRSIEAGRGGDDELRFAVNLLGVGGPVQSSIGLGSLTSAGGSSSR